MANGDPTKNKATRLESITEENIQTIARIEQNAHAQRTRADIVADAIAAFCGSTLFVWVHCVWFGLWLGINLLGSKSMHFDPAPFANLTLIVSLEAIFLSSFILVSQNRQQHNADQRNHLDLQINLLAEQESSLMLQMLKKVMDHLEIDFDSTGAEVLLEATDPQRLADQLEKSGIDKTSPPTSS
jgi:uncharacterized membrane protein